MQRDAESITAARIGKVVTVLACGVVLAGCQSTAGKIMPTTYAATPLSAPQARGKQQMADEMTKQRLTDGGTTGCAAGAGLGAAIGAIATDGSARGALMGMGAGCLLGAVAGLAVSSYIDGEMRTEADRQDALASVTAKANHQLSVARREAAGARAAVAEQKRRIALLNERLRTNQISVQDARAEQASARAALRTLGEQVARLENEITLHQNSAEKLAAVGANTAAYDRKRAELVAQRAVLTRAFEDLDRSMKTLPAAAQVTVG